MSKQIRKRLEIIEDRFGKMALRDFIKVEGGPDTPLHKAAHSGDYQRLKVKIVRHFENPSKKKKKELQLKPYLVQDCSPMVFCVGSF